MGVVRSRPVMAHRPDAGCGPGRDRVRFGPARSAGFHRRATHGEPGCAPHGRRGGRVGLREVPVARLRSPPRRVHPSRGDPHRHARGTRLQQDLLQPLPAVRPDAGGRMAGGDLRPWQHRHQKRQLPCRQRAGGARDRDHRHQRRRSRLRPAWYAAGELVRRQFRDLLCGRAG